MMYVDFICNVYRYFILFDFFIIVYIVYSIYLDIYFFYILLCFYIIYLHIFHYSNGLVGYDMTFTLSGPRVRITLRVYF